MKLDVGGTLAGLAILQGVAFQLLMEWTPYPVISIFFAALGALGFPFLLWNTFAKAVIDYRKR